MNALRIAILGLACAIASRAAAGPCLDLGIMLHGSEDANLDVLDKMAQTGRFETVEGFGPGPIGLFQHLDVVMVAWSSRPVDYDPNVPFRTEVGDALADFIDAGGGVLITQNGLSTYMGPGGRFGVYTPLYTASNCSYGVQEDLNFSYPLDDGLFSGVDSLEMTLYTRSSCADYTVTDGATLHASFPDGRPFVVSKPGVVAVNVYFASTDAHPDRLGPGYPADSDFPRLFANALYASVGFDAETACNGDYDDDEVVPVDTDDDGVADSLDNCPTVANPDQEDRDDNGIGDACDADEPEPDGDGVGVLDADDNCPDVANPDQEDGNGDGEGDACDPAITCDDTGSPALPALGLLTGLLLLRRRRKRSATRPPTADR